MREYIFRGRNIYNGKWVYGFLLVPIEGATFIRWYDAGHRSVIRNAQVDPRTVGQYTGLRDSKRTEEYPEGQMIFEGDILKTIFGVGYVVYGIGCFSVQYEPTNRPAIDIVMNDSDVFVIGNIHDNPELLEEGAK